MRKLVVLSSKGGVGKSSVVTGVAARAAQHGQRVLIVDADTTATATRRLRGISAPARSDDDLDALAQMLGWAAEPRDGTVPGGIDLTSELGDQHLLTALMEPTRALEELVTPSRKSWGEVYALASPGLPLEEWAQLGPTRRAGLEALRTVLRGAAGIFDLVVIDTPPTFGFTTTTAVAASSDMLLVVDGTPEAQSGLADGARQVVLEIDAARRAGLTPPAFLGVAVTKRPPDTKILRATRDTLRRFGDPRIAPHIVATYPASTVWARASADGEPVTVYADDRTPQLRAAVAAAAEQSDAILDRLDIAPSTPEASLV